MNDDPRWLDDPRNVRRIVYALYTLCGLIFLADLLYAKHPNFAFEGWFGFYAVFGFAVSFTLVLTAKEMRRVLRRDEDYYDEPERAQDDQ